MAELVVAARRFVDDLVRAEQLEVRRAAGVATELAAMIEALGRPPTGEELESWLGDHRLVEELYASTSALEALGDRYFRPPPAAPAGEARNPELERQLEDTLDPEPYLVYADWLQERGDPFGELIALGVASASGAPDSVRRFHQFLERHDKLFLRDVKHALGAGVQLDWHHGFISTVEETISTVTPAQWQKLLDLRVAALIRTVSLQRVTDEIDALLAAQVPTLRELRVRHSQMPFRLLASGKLRAVSLVLADITLAPDTLAPGIERLELECQSLVRSPSLGRLDVRELVLCRSQWRVDGTTFRPLEGLALPNLACLEIAGVDGELSDVLAIADSLGMPALRRLVIRRCEVDAGELAAVVRSSFGPRVTSLALPGVSLRDDDLAALAPLRGQLLELDISDNELSPAGVVIARALAPTVVVGTQHAPGTQAMQAIRWFAAGRFPAAEEIADPKSWKDAGHAADFSWARYEGSEPYELYVADDLGRYGCSCPSRYQPCKHVVALAIVAERTPLPDAPSNGIETRVGLFYL